MQNTALQGTSVQMQMIFKVCESLASVRWLGALYLSGKEEAKDGQMAQTVEMKDRDGGGSFLVSSNAFFNRI